MNYLILKEGVVDTEVREVREYHSNGFLKSIYFLNNENKKHGIYKEYWFDDGSLMQISFYNNDILETSIYFYKYGSKTQINYT